MTEPTVFERVTLAELRKQTGHTQAEVAEAIWSTQSGVARMERQDDLLVSTLRLFVAATGGELRLVAGYQDGSEYEIRVTDD